MEKFKFIFVLLAVIMTTFFIYSCATDSVELQDATIQSFETRSSGGDCDPQSVYPIFTGCTHQQRTVILDFSPGYSLYSTGSTLYQLCPGVQFSVTYTFTTCNLGGNGQVHFIHNLNYNLADIIAACPALQAEITNQQNLGNLIGFLDLLDFDISMQVEFTEAYNAALADPDRYLCGPNGVEFYNVKFIHNTCYRWVPFLDGPPDRPIPAFKKEACDGTICCIRIGQYCVSTFFNGEPVIQGTGNSTFEQTVGTCPLECTHECGDPTIK
jgi:hypothetical protein